MLLNSNSNSNSSSSSPYRSDSSSNGFSYANVAAPKQHRSVSNHTHLNLASQKDSRNTPHKSSSSWPYLTDHRTLIYSPAKPSHTSAQLPLEHSQSSPTLPDIMPTLNPSPLSTSGLQNQSQADASDPFSANALNNILPEIQKAILPIFYELQKALLHNLAIFCSQNNYNSTPNINNAADGNFIPTTFDSFTFISPTYGHPTIN